MVAFPKVRLPALLLTLPLIASWIDSTTGIDLDKLPRFPLTQLRSGDWLKPGAPFKFDGITAIASADPQEVTLTGVGKSGRTWMAHVHTLSDLWRGDLDHNGTQDYILFAVGPYGNGRTAPSFSLIILLMDQDGLPTPYFTVIYRGERGEGIKHILDIDRDGRAELLIQSYDENHSNPRSGPFCSGHWVNQLYRFDKLSVEEFRGSIGNMKFPLIHNWTDRACGLSETTSSIVPAIVEDHGTSATGELTTTLTQASRANELAVLPIVTKCERIQTDVLVYDRPRLREIATANIYTETQGHLANAIRRDQAPVRLRGLRPTWCRVNLLWASH